MREINSNIYKVGYLYDVFILFILYGSTIIKITTMELMNIDCLHLIS